MKDRQGASPGGSRAAVMRARLAAWEPTTRAFTAIDEAAFERLDQAEGALGGVAVGVKDIVDVRGLPTRNGSRVHEKASPAAADAAVVAALRGAGVAIVGKTVTTEFAFIDPATSRNPFDPRRTPGGSSSGSGAAVGAGVLDLAIGTQTAGSLCRPAAYCGAVGFKPSLGRLALAGVSPLAPSFDTIGFIARDAATAALALAAGAAVPADIELAAWRVGRAPVDPEAPMRDSALAALADALQRVAAGRRPARPSPDAGRGNSAAEVQAALNEGLAIAAEAAAEALDRLAQARARFWMDVEGFDLLLAPPVPDGAPLLDGTTGYQNLLTPWTVFGGPLLCLPWGLDDLGRPRSVMLAGRPGSDGLVLAAGRKLASSAPSLPRPRPLST